MTCFRFTRAAAVLLVPFALVVSFGAAAACRLSGGSGNQTASFPTIDPSLAAGPVTTVASVRFKCGGGDTLTWTLQGADGTTANPFRLQLVGNASVKLPYTVTVTQVPAPGANDTLQIAASIAQIDYQNAQVGAYSDVLNVTLLP